MSGRAPLPSLAGILAAHLQSKNHTLHSPEHVAHEKALETADSYAGECR